MEHQILKDELTERFNHSHTVELLAQEIAELLAERPPEMSINQYLSDAIPLLINSLRIRLSPNHIVSPADVKLDHEKVINGLIFSFERDLLRSHLHMIRALGSAIAERDTGTNEHNYRVTYYSVRLAEAVGFSKKEMQTIIKGSFLHDIGKIGIPDQILCKPDQLTEEERTIMYSHPKRGQHIIEAVTWLEDARDIVLNHHERYDGSGYPNQLKGDAIPLSARIFAIGDVFDALVSDRPYKSAIPFDEAFAAIKKSSGSHFDPELVKLFSVFIKHEYEAVSNADCATKDATMLGIVRKYFGSGAVASALPPPCD